VSAVGRWPSVSSRGEGRLTAPLPTCRPQPHVSAGLTVALPGHASAGGALDQHVRIPLDVEPERSRKLMSRSAPARSAAANPPRFRHRHD